MANPRPLTQPDPKAKYEFDQQFTFRLRRHKGGSFSGLWELSMLNKNGGVEKLLKDADALGYCIDDIQGVMEAGGF